MFNKSLILTYKFILTFFDFNKFEIYTSTLIRKLLQILSNLFKIPQIKYFHSELLYGLNSFFPLFLHSYLFHSNFSFFLFLVCFILLTQNNKITMSYPHPYKTLKFQQTLLSILFLLFYSHTYFHYMVLLLDNDCSFFHFLKSIFTVNHLPHTLYFAYRFIYLFISQYLQNHSYACL